MLGKETMFAMSPEKENYFLVLIYISLFLKSLHSKSFFFLIRKKFESGQMMFQTHRKKNHIRESIRKKLVA